jgi:pimeloyl-ACP methyl ester carboxylesterase
MQALNETTHMADAKAFIAWLDQQPSVAKNRKIGTQGYCMGGPIAFRTAAAVPDRVGAVASFHGGGLVDPKGQPNSPHLQASKTKAQFLIAIAENDDARAPKDKDVLKETFSAAKLPAEIEATRARTAGARLTRGSTASRRPKEPGLACSPSTARLSPERRVKAVVSFLLLAVTAASIAVSGQSTGRQAAASAPLPKTPWGEPDLQGVWNYGTMTPLERPAQWAGKDVLTQAEAEAYEKQTVSRRGDNDAVTAGPDWWELQNHV